MADGSNNQIDKITPVGTVSLFAQLPTGSLPEGLAFDGIGNLFETGLDNKVRKITAGGGEPVCDTASQFGPGGCWFSV